MNFITLGATDLAIASLLVIINGGLSLMLGLGLERQLLIAAARMVVQLSLMGLVLKTLFALVSPLWTAVAALIMVLFAGHEASARQRKRFSGWWTYGLGTSSMMAAGLIVTVLALTTQIKPDPWYDPRYALPLLGMILGNTMNGVALVERSYYRCGSGKKCGRSALGTGPRYTHSNEWRRSRSGSNRFDSYYKCHGSSWHCLATRNDDGANSRRHSTGGSREVSNSYYVFNRWRYGTWPPIRGLRRRVQVKRLPTAVAFG